jgi:hypothetical protein
LRAIADQIAAALADRRTASGDLIWRDPRDRVDQHHEPVWLVLPSDAVRDSGLAHEVLIRTVTGSEDSSAAVATSVRVPAGLHQAARAAVDARWVSSLTQLVVAGIRAELIGLAASALDQESVDDVREALDEHYASEPEARPSLAMVVERAAQMDGHPAGGRPDLIEAAVLDLGDGAFVEDVLAWVRGALAVERQAAGGEPAGVTNEP